MEHGSIDRGEDVRAQYANVAEAVLRNVDSNRATLASEQGRDKERKDETRHGPIQMVSTCVKCRRDSVEESFLHSLSLPVYNRATRRRWPTGKGGALDCLYVTCFITRVRVSMNIPLFL